MKYPFAPAGILVFSGLLLAGAGEQLALEDSNLRAPVGGASTRMIAAMLVPSVYREIARFFTRSG